MIADRHDRPLLAAAGAHGALVVLLLALAPGPLAVPLLALAMCWSANTVSHLHLHAPLFRRRSANALFSLYLTVLLAIPQGHWRRRHLRHHELADHPRAADSLELAALLAAVVALAWAAPHRIAIWAPATALGFALCALQGWGEHAAAALGVDHHGRLYNRLWFNDGFHAAHHRHPELRWRELPARVRRDDAVSPWPPLLRWLSVASLLDRLESLALRRPWMQRLLLRTHEPALRALLVEGRLDGIREVTIVGGGLYPRSALLLGRLLPRARLTIIDESAAHLAMAAAHLGPVELVHAHFDGSPPAGCDLLVIPLGFRGDRARLYQHPPAPAVLVHDWLWRRRGSRSAAIWPLGKRLNLVLAARDVDNLCLGGPLPPEEPAPCHRPICSSASARATTLPSW